MFDAAGKIANFMAVKEDISEYMEAEAARQRTSVGFHTVFAALPFAVLVIDAAGRILLANSAAASLLDTQQLPGTKLESLNLRWLDANGVGLAAEAHPVMQVLKSKNENADVSMRLGLVPPTGGTRWLNATVRSVRLPDSEELGVLLVLDRIKD